MKNTLAIETDTRLADLYGRRMAASAEVHNLVESRKSIVDGIAAGKRYAIGPDYIADMDRRIAAGQATIAAIRADEAPLEAIYEAHRWTRAFLVTSSTGGHVHRSMSCSTCYPSTWFVWLPNYSGEPEADIVADAGERACTVCYPTAPVGVKGTRIYSNDERDAMARRDARAAAKVARDAKRAAAAPTAAGTPLVVTESRTNADGSIRSYRHELATEVTAVREYVHYATMLPYMTRDVVEAAATRTAMTAIVEALAGKHGITTAEMTTRLATKVAKANR